MEIVCIPATVNSIFNAFVSCENLTQFTAEKGNKVFYIVDGILFEKHNKCKVSIVVYPGGIKGAYTIPGKVDSIGEQAFFGAAGITKITIPGAVAEIYPNAFDSCVNLTEVTIKKEN